jgi:hypothetical protein
MPPPTRKARGKKKGSKPLPPIPSRVISKNISAPAARGKNLSGLGRPNIQKVGNSGDIIVVHKEFVTDLMSSATATAFSLLGLPVNPGNSNMFPWLSSIARSFESFVFDGLKFLFETASPSSTAGTVLMAVDYDVNDNLPADKRAMMSYKDAVRSEAWSDVILNCSREDVTKRKTYFVGEDSDFSAGTPGYVVNAPIDTSGDRRLDDVGNLLIASSGQTAANTPLGEVYVEYRCKLMTPVTTPGSVPFYNLLTGSTQALTPAKPFGAIDSSGCIPNVGFSTAVPAEYSGLPVNYNGTGGASSVFNFGASGWYYIEEEYVGTGIGAITNTASNGDTSLVLYGVTSVSNLAGTRAIYRAYLNVNSTLVTPSATSPRGTYAWAFPTVIATTITSAVCRIWKVPPYLAFGWGPALAGNRQGRAFRKAYQVWCRNLDSCPELVDGYAKLLAIEDAPLPKGEEKGPPPAVPHESEEPEGVPLEEGISTDLSLLGPELAERFARILYGGEIPDAFLKGFHSSEEAQGIMRSLPRSKIYQLALEGYSVLGCVTPFGRVVYQVILK